jgi:hypothetical protein
MLKSLNLTKKERKMSKGYDWSQPVMSLLHKLQEADVQIISVNDGYDYENVVGDSKLAVRKDAADMITAVDESWVRVQYKDEFATLFIVLGNDANEILADYSYQPSSELEGIIESVSEAFYEQWEDVPCPTVG